jgi:hypothetical protein
MANYLTFAYGLPKLYIDKIFAYDVDKAFNLFLLDFYLLNH